MNIHHKISTILAVLSVLSTGCMRSSADYVALGNIAEAKGRISEADLNYRKAIQKDSQYWESYYRLGLLEAGQGRTRQAFQLFRRASELNPSSDEAKKQLGDTGLEIYLTTNPKPQVIYDVLRALAADMLKKNPKSYDGLRLRAYLESVDGNLDSALALFEQANTVKSGQPDLLSGYAGTLVRAGQSAKAEQLLKDALAANPNLFALYDSLYSYYEQTKNLAAGEQILLKKVSLAPNAINSQLQLAQHYVRTGNEENLKRVATQILSDTKSFPNGRLFLGDFYASVQRYAEAEALYKEGIAQNADVAQKQEYRQHLAALYIERTRPDDALNVINEVVSTGGDNNTVRFVQALLKQSHGTTAELTEAVGIYQSLLSTTTNIRPAILFNQLGMAYRALGNIPEARVAFQQSVQKSTAYLAPRFSLAQLMVEAGQFSNAQTLLDEILRYSPDHPDVQILRARTLRGTNRFGEARTELLGILRNQPGNQDVELELALVELDQSRYEQAERLFKKHYVVGMTDHRPLIGLVQSAMSQKQVAKAIELLKVDMAKSADDREQRMYLAGIGVTTGNYELAKEQYEILIAKYPQNPQLHLRLADVYRLNGSAAQGESHLRKALAIQPENGQVLATVAAGISTLGKLEEAAALYKKALEKIPDDPTILNNAAYNLGQLGKWDAAFELAQHALRVDPTSEHAQDTLAVIFSGRKQYDRAEQVFLRLINEKPNGIAYRLHYAQSLIESGKKKEAKVVLEQAQRLPQSEKDTSTLKALLSSL